MNWASSKPAEVKRLRGRLAERTVPYVLILPNLAIYFLFVALPVLWVLYLSFTDFSLLTAASWIGLDNYKQLIQDSIFHKAIRNTTFYWVFTVVPAMGIGLVVASLLHARPRGVSVYRASIYLPGVISSVAVAMTWLWIFNPRQGLANAVMAALGWQQQDWLRDPDLALSLVTGIGVWTVVGFAMLIYLAGLQGIPDHLYEAAGIDGATVWQKFVHITVPMTAPISFFLLITLSIRSFQVFDLVYVLTGGGPLHSTTTMVSHIVQTGFQEYRMGFASAMAIALLLITVLITALNYNIGSARRE